MRAPSLSWLQGFLLASAVLTHEKEHAVSVVRRVSVNEQQVVKTEELQRSNEALRDTQAQLVEKERLAVAGQVVVGLHHEILNPLTGILGAMQVLKQEGERT